VVVSSHDATVDASPDGFSDGGGVGALVAAAATGVGAATTIPAATARKGRSHDHGADVECAVMPGRR